MTWNTDQVMTCVTPVIIGLIISLVLKAYFPEIEFAHFTQLPLYLGGALNFVLFFYYREKNKVKQDGKN